MANLRRRIPQQTKSLFAENHEAFFNSIGHQLPRRSQSYAAETASIADTTADDCHGCSGPNMSFRANELDGLTRPEFYLVILIRAAV
jgi:hypothetical protein